MQKQTTKAPAVDARKIEDGLVIDHLSHSSLEVLATCPRQFVLHEFRLAEELPPAPIAETGSLIHEKIAEWIKVRFIDKTDEKAELNIDIPKTTLKKIQSTLKRELKGVESSKIWVEIELRDENLPIPFVAKPDLVYVKDEVLAIIDHKTGGYSDEISEKEKRQLERYLPVVYSMMKELIGDVKMAVLKIHRTNKGMLTLGTYTLGDIRKLRENLVQELLEAKFQTIPQVAHHPKPVVSPACFYCPYAISCLKTAISSGDLPRVFVVSKAISDRLREYFKNQEEPIVLDNIWMGTVSSEKRKVAKSAIEEFISLIASGKVSVDEAAKIVGISPSKAENLAKYLDKDIDEIIQYYTTSDFVITSGQKE